MITYYRLFTRLKQAKLIQNYSPKDIIELAKSIYKIKITANWHLSEITVKTKEHFKTILIDNLK